MIKFNQHNVTDTTTKTKARVTYSLDNRGNDRPCVTLYAKDYANALGKIIQDAYRNDTDSMTDYFETGRVVLFADHPLYAAAREAANHAKAAQAERYDRLNQARRERDQVRRDCGLVRGRDSSGRVIWE